MKRVLPLLFLAASCARGGSPDVQVTDAWARETGPRQSATAAYMTIINRGSGSDRLLGVGVPPPASAMMHESSNSAGISTMRAVERGVEIPPGGRVELKPLGAHVMVTGLGAPLSAGGTLPLTLRFERSGERKVDAQVVGATSAGRQ
jgi:periplasmic copper chaperone A